MTWSEDENWAEEYSSSSPSPYRISNSHDDEEDEEYSSKPPLKRLKTFDINVNDKLSRLPDSLLHHILSFFSMSEVIQTSEISRRWRYIWKPLPSLNFGFISARSIDKIFLLRNDDAEIDKLFLSCDLKYEYIDDLRDVFNWMNIAERGNLRELYLYLPCIGTGFSIDLPEFPFTSEKLEVLKLKSNDYLQLPISMCYAVHLKTIELHRIILPDQKQEKEVNITCPSLVELKISNCDHRDIRILHISAPKLETLVLNNRYSEYIDSCEICIFTPNIKSLVLKGRTYPSYSFGNLSSLVNATFCVYGKSVSPAILYQVLRGLYNVRNLVLEVQSLDSSKEDTDAWDQIFNLFANLRSLDITGFQDCFSAGVIRSLLINTPSIENLIVEIDHLGLHKDWTELLKCVSRLKYIEIYRVQGREIELKIFEFVLGNAVVLEAFNCIADKRYHWKTKKDQAYFSTVIFSA